jgi:putative flippase GtrA
MIERLFIFAKAQVSSFVGGIVDYLFMILFTELFHIPYPVSIVIGGIAGAFVNFILNKGWAFFSKDVPYHYSGKHQLFYFMLVVINSIFLKVSGTWFITTYFRIDYKISRVFTDLIVSIIFNYMLQRHWVFKRKHVYINGKES